MSDEASPLNVSELVVNLVCSYLTHNRVQISELPELIDSVHQAVVGLLRNRDTTPEKLVPPVPINRSVTAEYIVCLEDGRRMKTLRRHLRTAFGMTPEEYRAKWGLPRDYPMVCGDYTKQRSELARKTGLGNYRRREVATETPANENAAPEPTPGEGEAA